MTSIYLITGYLGSGKTSFLNNQLNGEKNVGVLINEFGKIGIDSYGILPEFGKLIELNNGSIFCACLKDNFINALVQLIDANLDYILIEASGLSDPSNMKSILEVVDKLAVNKSFEYLGSVCLIDGVHFLKTIDKMSSVEKQILSSQLGLISKSDLPEKSNVGEIIKRVQSINPNMKILIGNHEKYDLDAYFSQMRLDLQHKETINRMDNRPLTAHIKFIGPVNCMVIEKALKELQGIVFRAKGIMITSDGTVKLDWVIDSFSVTQLKDDVIQPAFQNQMNILVLFIERTPSSISCIVEILEKYFSKNALFEF